MYDNNYPNDYENNNRNNQNNSYGTNNTNPYYVNNEMNSNAESQSFGQPQNTQSTQNTQSGTRQFYTEQAPRGLYSGYMPTENVTPTPPKKKKEGHGAFWKKTAAVAMAGVLFGGCAAGSFYIVDRTVGITSGLNKEATVETGNSNVMSTTDGVMKQTVTTVVTDVTSVVDKVMPASVSITNSFTATGQSFFGATYEVPQEASGSGIIIGKNDTELLIVTNNHVVNNADSLQVKFINGNIVEAQFKGNAPTMDLAVISIRLEDLSQDTLNSITIAEMGDSAMLSIGEPAIAIGNSLGYGQSVTTGVISALDRELIVEGEKVGTTLIQTDAAINPGNSGGALVNMNGEVIGINSNKIGGTVVEGMGYAIPISAAKPILENLMSIETREKVSDEARGYLGITGANITTEVAEVYDGMPKGVYIVTVADGSGAQKAGLKKGNIITKVEGISVGKIEELNEKLSYYEAGDTIMLTVAVGSPEGYQEQEVEVTLSGTEIMNQ